jgi:hypothetical protein
MSATSSRTWIDRNARDRIYLNGVKAFGQGGYLLQQPPSSATDPKDTHWYGLTVAAVIAGAALAGLMTGSFAVRTYAVRTGANAGVSIQTMDDAQKGKHACNRMNECKGQGGL